MSTTELRKKLIQKINTTEDQDILEEVFRLLEIEGEDISTYKLSEDQKNVVEESRGQIVSGKSFDNKAADDAIDEWLGK
ncbi:MAG: hypothetical protein R2820_14615 [Cyclobacteriaceae bacterium]|nr:hypothetical protein [Cyclobacteriaceae bacterium]